ncbi:MAG TPA: sterol desaturase family protein [Polyangiaceae bacterium]|nr:sterol desaturase family protein [Polyangiaceae bacterium]
MASRADSSQSPRMFESDFIDYFSRCPFWVVPILYVPAILAMLAASRFNYGVGWLATGGLFLAGFAFWTFAEYWLHRTVFHYVGSSAFAKRVHFLIHGVHHQWPHDKLRLVFPPGASIPLYIGFLALFVLAFGRYGLGFHAGFAAGYMFYDLSHYWLHHGKPRSEYGRRLRRNHYLHHFKETHARFGVSMVLWDRVFGTTGSGNASASETERQRKSSGPISTG